MPGLPTIWFVLIAFLFTGYAILDGFDLGAGALHFYVARTDEERRQVLSSIGPVWDGNEVWLVTGGGALFAAFPLVYATVFSGFYLAMMLVLLALIVRAISIEFRGKEENRMWRAGWDLGFFLGSSVAALLFGVALGNLLRGIALDSGGVYRDGLIGLLNPFALVVGVLTLALAVQQGAAWLVLKTEGNVAARARKAHLAAIAAVVVAWIVATVLATSLAPRVFDNFRTNAVAWVAPVLAVSVIFFGVRSAQMGQAFRSFLMSTAMVVLLAATAVTALYPNLVPAVETARSLTVDNTHSSDLTLTVMLVMALIGMPIVLAYTAYIYWKFKGKVQVGENSY